MIAVAILALAILIVAIYVIIEIKRTRHKIFAVFLIALILFLFISSVLVLKDENINFTTISGLIQGGKIYFFWLTSVFTNMKTITSYAIKMDWGTNQTAG